MPPTASPCMPRTMVLAAWNLMNQRPIRYGYIGDLEIKEMVLGREISGTHKKRRRLRNLPMACSSQGASRNSHNPNFYQEVLEDAREKFTQEISFQSEDNDISLAKALLYVAAEDEAFLAFNREIDARSLQSEMTDTLNPSDALEWRNLEEMRLAGKTLPRWLAVLDAIAEEVAAELASRDVSFHSTDVLQAVNLVLFKSRHFRRFLVLGDPRHSYLPSVLNSGCGSAIIISVIYIEVCRRLNFNLVGSQVGEDFLLWLQTENLEDLPKSNSGLSFRVVNGKYGVTAKSDVSRLEIATNRDIIGIALANLTILHWKRATRMSPGLMLTSPLRPFHNASKRLDKIESSSFPLVRPQDLRLAIMASERLLVLQPRNWALRRDHGMMLYFNRKYKEAVQELSICMALAPVEEANVLKPFVEKLHLLQLEWSWTSLGNQGPLTIH